MALCLVQARWHMWQARPPFPLPRSGTGASTSNRLIVWGPNPPFPGSQPARPHVGSRQRHCQRQLSRAGKAPPPFLFFPHLLRSGRGARLRCGVRGRARLARCGDVHPHPGPLQVAVSNVTALRPSCHTVFAWEADVVLLGETRLTATGLSHGATGPRSRLAVLLGAPLESRGGGIWDCPPGATAVLVRQGLPARQVMPPAKEGEESLVTALWHSTK